MPGIFCAAVRLIGSPHQPSVLNNCFHILRTPPTERQYTAALNRVANPLSGA
jgi:hypothetical protein